MSNRYSVTSTTPALDGDALGGGTPTTNSDAMAGSGWSTASATGGAVASWASSPARLTLDCDPGAAGSCGVTHTTKLPNREEYSIAIRVQVVNGDNSNQTRVILACGQSASDCAQMAFFTDGSIEVGATIGGSYVYWYVASTIAAIDSTARTGGELWLRFDRMPGLIAISCGRSDFSNTGPSSSPIAMPGSFWIPWPTTTSTPP